MLCCTLYRDKATLMTSSLGGNSRPTVPRAVPDVAAEGSEVPEAGMGDSGSTISMGSLASICRLPLRERPDDTVPSDGCAKDGDAVKRGRRGIIGY